MKRYIIDTILFIIWLFLLYTVLFSAPVKDDNNFYDLGFQRGAECGSKLGYDFCIELLNNTKEK